ncbi:MAG: OPT/YSL family transporter, partial [Myxococcota bacterium]|nr:OPT/YSL family transporter [Myxococcota bacterium]
MNVYMGLKIGWSFGGSLIAAILGFAAFKMMRTDLSVLETNITQTAGSGAGTMASAAGLLACIPALSSLGYEISTPALFAWTFSVAYLGVFFAVPLRRQVVVIDKLRFPTGTATAQTILAMFAEAGEAVAKARALIWFGAGAGVFTVATYFVPELEMPPVDALGVGLLTLAAAWSFKLYFGPMLFGAGLLIGPRVSFSMMGGAILAWAILGPLVQQAGWAPGAIMSYTDGPRGWILWPGVAIMVSEAMTALALNWRTFIRAFQSSGSGEGSVDTAVAEEQIPPAWWMTGLAIASLLTVTVTFVVFDIPPYLSILAIALSSVLAVVAVRSTGETDINPVGGMGKVSQLAYGAIAPGMVTTNLLAAGITGSGASQAGDMMQDLKTGYLLGASPRQQFKAQLIGIVSGILCCVPAYLLVTSAYEIGGDQLPAPAAKAWAAVAELLSEGLGSLPPNAAWAVLIGIGVGGIFPVLRKYTKLGPWLPSGLAIGIAFIIPAFYSMVIALGALGLGAVPGSLIGTVCERVVRRSPIDCLVIKDPAKVIGDGPLVVGLDGSDRSYGALKTAFDIARRVDAPVHAVAVYDPYYHYVAFNRIA